MRKTKQKLFALSLCLALVSLMAICVGCTAIAGASAELSLSPATKTVSIGDNFFVDVLVNTSGKNVVVVAAYLNYDPTELKVVSINTSNSVFTMEIEKTADPTTGEIEITLGKPTPGVNTTRGNVATINFEALDQASPANVTFVLTSSGATGDSGIILDDGKGTDILSSVKNGAYFIGGGVQPPTISYVPEDYPTIQAAIEAASSGDTIIVRNGTYNENVDVNKCVTLRGEDRNTTIIDTEAVTMQISCNSTITGFTIKNGTYGIECVNPIAPYIANNIFTTIGGTCIMVWDSSASPVITNNEFTNNYHSCIRIPSPAIISNNTFYSNGDGIFNDGGGIDVCIFIDGSSSLAITGNIIRNNAAYGIVTSASSQRITSNIISGNVRGIWDWGGSSFTIFNNTIADNEYGVYLSSSTDSIIYFNNFVGNARNAYSSDSTNFWNSPSEITYIYNDNTYTQYLGNYWDEYMGSDANGDGIGDTAYRIDSEKDNYPLVRGFEDYKGVT